MAASPGRELLLVLGGARSGKSSWALRHVESHYSSYLFLATARVNDDEMAERVRLHRESRGTRWKLLEEPLEVPRTLRTGPGDAEAVLVDCLTVWMSNVLIEKGEAAVESYQDGLLEALSQRDRTIVIVSNEVGMGIVPETYLGRFFRDTAGRFNQRVAAMADRVVFMIAGLPMALKGDLQESAGPAL